MHEKRFFGTKLTLSVAIPCSYRQLLRYWKMPGRPPNRPGRLPYDVIAYRNWIGSFATAHNRKSLNSVYATSQNATDTKTAEEFRELLRMAIRYGLLTTQEILEIILDRTIEAWGPKLISKEFGRVAEVIHNGFGAAVMLLEADPATDEFLKRSAAALTRASRRRSANI